MAQLPAHVQEHIYSVGIVDYFGAHAPLPEGCKLYETRAAARAAAGVAAWAAARGYAWDAAQDAAWDAAEGAGRTAECLLVRHLIDPKHLAYALRQIRLLQRWVNNRIIFKSVPRFEDYDARRCNIDA